MAKNQRLQRITVTITQDALKLLKAECERRRSLEACKVPPARIINELILKYLADHSRDGAPKRVSTREGKAAQSSL